MQSSVTTVFINDSTFTLYNESDICNNFKSKNQVCRCLNLFPKLLNYLKFHAISQLSFTPAIVIYVYVGSLFAITLRL